MRRRRLSRREPPLPSHVVAMDFQARAACFFSLREVLVREVLFAGLAQAEGGNAGRKPS